MRTLKKLKRILADDLLKSSQVNYIIEPFNQISIQCRVCRNIITDINDFHNGPQSISKDGVQGKDGNRVVSAFMCTKCWEDKINKWLFVINYDVDAAKNLWFWFTLHDSRINNWKRPWTNKNIIACIEVLLSNLREYDACSVGDKLLSLSLIKIGRKISDEPLRFKKIADEKPVPEIYKDPPLIQAVRSNNMKKVKESLSQGDSIDGRDKNGNTALMIASRKGYRRIVKTLIKAGCDLEAKNEFQNTALSEAIGDNRIAIIKTLIKSGADVNYGTKSDDSMLAMAGLRQNARVFKYLLNHGLDIRRNNCGTEALHRAAFNGSPSVIKVLIKYGVNINATDKYGWTAIMMAVRFDKIVNVKLLYKLGADISIKNNEGQTVNDIINNKGKDRESLRKWINEISYRK